MDTTAAGGLPGAPQRVPGLPSNFRPIVIEGWAGIDTQDLRPAISDHHFTVCDGFMPVGPNSLRIVPDIGPDLYTSGTPGDIVWFGSGNIGDQEYFFAAHANGSMTAITVPGGVATTIMPATTITNPRSVQGFSQWGSQYILFSSDQTNGYWLWDGTLLYTAGQAGPIVNLTDSGDGYTTVPTVTAVGGSGTGITLLAHIANGSVTQVTVTNAGSNYAVGDNVLAVFTGGNGTTTPYGAASLSNGVITSTFLQSGGAGYQNSSGVQSPPTVTITDSTGTGAVIVVDGMAGGIITSLKVVSGGANYVAPTLSFGGPGSGAAALAFTSDGVITNTSLTNAGTGLTTTPAITFLSATGAGAVAFATLNSSGAVSQIQIQSGGKGYSSPVLMMFTGGGGPASGTVQMMSFGVSGTWIEPYQGHVWIGNGAAVAAFPPKGRVIYSAGGSPVNFGGDGGAFIDTNSFGRIGYHSGKQTNGFLYLIGDSSLDYISGVTQSSTATTATTTFNNQNADPQIGSPYPSSTIVYSRNLAFANPVGVYVSLGGSVTKVSHPLDGIYQASPAPAADYPSAVANLFGHVVYMMLAPVINLITDLQETKLICWDGESQAKPWFTSKQSRQLTYITTRETDSILEAYGTDGTHIFQLFAVPSTSFTKTFQTKLYANPAYWMTKTANELFGIIADFTQPITITVDNELGTGAGGGSVSIPVSTNEFDVFGPIPCGQFGSLIGLTVSTTSADGIVNSLTIMEQDEATRV